jgi:hypothetical protein
MVKEKNQNDYNFENFLINLNDKIDRFLNKVAAWKKGKEKFSKEELDKEFLKSLLHKDEAELVYFILEDMVGDSETNNLKRLDRIEYIKEKLAQIMYLKEKQDESR